MEFGLGFANLFACLMEGMDLLIKNRADPAAGKKLQGRKFELQWHTSKWRRERGCLNRNWRRTA